MRLNEVAGNLGIDICCEFDIELLIPQKQIRSFCLQNKCGNYGNNYMCPPHVGSIEEIKIKIKQFKRGTLFQYAKNLDVTRNGKAIVQTQKDFHGKILIMENLLVEKGFAPVWGMIGGNCRLCETCNARKRGPCPKPDKARMSLEAAGIDVLRLLDKLGLDSQFHRDKITWTGCILFNDINYSMF